MTQRLRPGIGCSCFALLLGLPACDTTETIGESTNALSAEQCDYFSANGSVQICHATSSSTKPYVILKVSGAACVSAHADHSSDYIAVNDPTCHGLGCLPQSAPCDDTAPCCEGLVCSNGTCQPALTCAQQGYADASSSGCTCPSGELTCYSPTPGVGILCVDQVTGVSQFAAPAGATCGPFACAQYGWTSATNCSCADNGNQPVACTDQNGSTDCHWRQGTGYAGVFGNNALLSCP